jgi:hypothetical protein
MEVMSGFTDIFMLFLTIGCLVIVELLWPRVDEGE